MSVIMMHYDVTHPIEVRRKLNLPEKEETVSNLENFFHKNCVKFIKSTKIVTRNF